MSTEIGDKNSLSKKISVLSLAKFTLPSIAMMIVMAFYTMVDGIFVARLIDTDAFAAVNIVYPILNIVNGVGIMLAAGGCAFVGKELGEKKDQIARRHFSMVVYFGIGIGLIGMALSITFIDPIITFLGASPITYEYCYDYGFILMLFMPVEILQILFQYFFVVAGRPIFGLVATIVGGVANIVLDYYFIAVLDMGVGGAALATGIGFTIPAVTGIVYFSVKRKGTLYLTFAKLEWNPIKKIMQNGSSEMVASLALSVTTILFNWVMLKYIGETGVAAISIMLYVDYLLNAVFFGYEIGVAPLFSYNYGAGNKSNLKKLMKLSLRFIAVAAIIIFFIANVFSDQLIGIFVEPNDPVFAITKDGLWLFSLAFLVMGFNIFASAVFTALSNGKISALISFLRTFLLLSGAILLLPELFGIGAVWLAVPVAESVAIIVSLICILKYRKRYEYL